jgi:hypothetical protein
MLGIRYQKKKKKRNEKPELHTIIHKVHFDCATEKKEMKIFHTLSFSK